ncbi:MAG TPA: prepilin-type N-terminal cleavage/methylation domain-containing protein, partial [Candidatus Angelobacter sp.]|nr:prepilin-type N-terminal cleavage/methylation domain-containing protein [Candidatus Angelobacter sp.]
MQKRTIRTSPAFTPSTKLTGFTIAELLVAIVIIGILATLTIISYIGIQQKAIVASINSDLVSSSRTLKLF